MTGQYQQLEDQLKVFVRDMFVFFSVLDMYKVLEPFKADMNEKMSSISEIEKSEKSLVFNISPEKYIKMEEQDMGVGLFGQSKKIVGEVAKVVVGNTRPTIDINLTPIVNPIQLGIRDIITLILSSYYVWASQVEETSQTSQSTVKQTEISASNNQIKAIQKKYLAEIKNGDSTCRKILQMHFASVDKKGLVNLYISYIDKTHKDIANKVNMLTTSKIENIGGHVIELVDMVKNDPLINSS